MQFRLSEELEMIRSVVKEFANRQAAPGARERDEEERMDRKLFEAMGGLGLTGITWPEQYGGSGGDVLTLVVVVEELSKVCASTAAMLAAHTVNCGSLIHEFGSASQKEKFLPGLADGTNLGTCSYKSRVKAAASGGSFALSGSNQWVSAAGEADVYLIFTDKYDVFIVEKGTPGFQTGRKLKKLGMRSYITGEIVFKNCSMTEQNLLGERGAGRGQQIAEAAKDLKNIASSALALGIAQGALLAAVDYAKERKQFGKAIGLQQGISFKLADMAAAIEAARWLTYQAAWRKDAGLPFRKEAALARKFTTDAAVAATVEAVQVFGGYGYMREYAVERYMRDAKTIQADEGAFELQQEAVLRMLAE